MTPTQSRVEVINPYGVIKVDFITWVNYIIYSYAGKGYYGDIICPMSYGIIYIKNRGERFMIYVTLIPSLNYYNTKIFSVGQVLKLVKEPSNIYDFEAIRVECAGIGKIGYVANSVNTVVKGTYSAGRLYDKMDNEAYCRVLFVTKSEAIGEVIENPDREVEEEFRNSEDYVRKIMSYFEKTDLHFFKNDVAYKLEESLYKEEEIP